MKLLPRLRLLAALAVLLALQSVSLAQGIDTAAVDALVQDAMKAWQAPGVAVAIVKDDAVVYLKGFGVRAAGGKEPVTPDTLFACASTSKAFTTTLIAMLVLDGKMRWDDPVGKYLDFFHLSDPLADRNVTLRDLVTHRTGLSRHDLLWLGGTSWGREEIMRRIGLVKLTQPFRSAYQYQNIMFLTAGYAAGKADGSSWEELVQKRIFDPLGMKGANFSTNVAAKAPDHATPHSSNGTKIAPSPWRNIDHIGPAGSINAGVRDLAQWLRFQLGDGSFAGKRLLSTQLLAETHSPQMVMPFDGSSASASRILNPDTNLVCYGLGWIIQDYRGQPLVSHGGSIDGFRAQVALLPKQRFGVAILSNLGRTQLPEALRNGIVDLALAAPKRDWNAIFLAQAERAAAAERAREQKFFAKRQPDTKPSRELPAYTGTYEEPAYGQATVALDGSTLTIQWTSLKVRLEHFHFDTFIAKGDPLVNNRPVVFSLGADGEVEKLGFVDQEFKKARAK